MTMTPVCSCSTRCCSLLRWSRLLDLAPPEAFNIWHWGPYISFHETRFRPTLRWESSPILADAYHTHLDHDSDPYVSRTTTTTWLLLLLNFVLPKNRRRLIFRFLVPRFFFGGTLLESFSHKKRSECFWKQALFTLAAILNFLKISISQTFMKTKLISNCFLGLYSFCFYKYVAKKFNMAARVKNGCFQII